MADHLDTAAWAHLQRHAAAHAKWARPEARAAFAARVHHVSPSAAQVAGAIDDVYRDIADLRTAEADPPAPTDESGTAGDQG